MATIEHDSMGRDVSFDDEREEELRLRDLVAVVKAGKWRIFGFVVCAIGLALLYLYHTPPVYQANALLQVEQSQTAASSSMDQLQQMAQMVTGGSTPADTEIQILTSRSVVGQAVRKLGLDIHAAPRYFPFVGAAIARHAAGQSGPVKPWFGLKDYAWGGEHIKVTRLIVPDALQGTDLTLVALGGKRYRLQTKDGQVLLHGHVGEAAQSSDGKVKIFVESLVARPDEQFVVSKDRSLQAVNSLKSRMSVDEQGKDTGIILMTLSDTDPAHARKILNTIANVFLRQNVERRSAQAQNSLTFIEKQLPELRNKLNAAESKFAAYQQRHQAVDLTAEAKSVLRQLVDLEQNIDQLKLKRSEYAQLYTSKHPQVKALEQQIGTLEHKKHELEKHISNMPETQKHILELQRDVDVTTQIYTNLLNEAQQLKIVKAGTVGSVRIIDHAALPDQPVSPRAKLTLVVAVILGLLAGVGWLFLRRALRSGITDPKLIEEQLGLPVYAVIPHSSVMTHEERRARRGGRALPLLARQRPQDVAVESLRSLRTSLHFALMESESKVIVVTGSSPGVGKSFVTMNLGLLIASSGQRVAIVDGDMRRGKMHEYLQLERAPGLSDVLVGTATLDRVMHPLDENGSALLTSGTIPPNPSELLMNQRCGEMLSKLEGRFDVVLVDTPPVMAVTDAAILGSHAGATFLVVKAGVNPMPEVEESIKRLRQNHTRVTGALFNDFRKNEAAGTYGSYAYYDYKYH